MCLFPGDEHSVSAERDLMKGKVRKSFRIAKDRVDSIRVQKAACNMRFAGIVKGGDTHEFAHD